MEMRTGLDYLWPNNPEQISSGAKSSLGHLVREASKFLYEGKLYPNYEIYKNLDSNEKEPARNFFYRRERKGLDIYLLKQDKLPLDPHIRAIVVKGKRLTHKTENPALLTSSIRGGQVLAETTKIDFDKLRKAVSKENMDVNIQKGRKSINYNGEKILQTETKNAFPKMPSEKKDMRTLIRILPAYQEKGWEQAMQVLDIIDGQNCYNVPGENTAYGETIGRINNLRTQELRVEQTLELQQLIQQIQVPILALQLEMNPALFAKIVYNSKVLEMDNQEIKDHLKNSPAVQSGFLVTEN